MSVFCGTLYKRNTAPDDPRASATTNTGFLLLQCLPNLLTPDSFWRPPNKGEPITCTSQSTGKSQSATAPELHRTALIQFRLNVIKFSGAFYNYGSFDSTFYNNLTAFRAVQKFRHALKRTGARSQCVTGEREREGVLRVLVAVLRHASVM